MSQASFWWKQVIYIIKGSSKAKFKSRVFRSVSRNQLREIGGWLLCIISIVAMFFWNWKLLLATGAGVALMLLVYLIPGFNWQAHVSKWRRFLTGSNRKLTIAVGSGSVGALSTYMAASIWADSPNRWLATSTILQGFGTLITLALLIWHIINHQGNRNEAKFEQLLKDLTNEDPVARLISVRQLTRLVSKTHSRGDHRHQLGEYFRLMVSVEQEPVIREAVLESLQMFEQQKLKTKGNQPLQIPIALQPSPSRVPQKKNC